MSSFTNASNYFNVNTAATAGRDYLVGDNKQCLLAKTYVLIVSYI